MKNLINFLIKHSFSIFFVFLEIICFVFIFTMNGYQRAAFFNSANVATAFIQDKTNSLVEYIHLNEVNDSLHAENLRLRKALERYRQDNIPPLIQSGFDYIPAKVVSATVNKVQNYITIDRGSSSGITNETGVINACGVVGIVVSVSEKYATVLPLVNPDAKLSVKIKKNNYFGSLSWNKKNVNELLLSEIPGYVDLDVGDEIVTSGFSAIFPDGLPVGKIKSFSKNVSTDFYEIVVTPLVDFYNVNYVYVITNGNKQQQRINKLGGND